MDSWLLILREIWLTDVHTLPSKLVQAPLPLNNVSAQILQPISNQKSKLQLATDIKESQRLTCVFTVSLVSVLVISCSRTRSLKEKLRTSSSRSRSSKGSAKEENICLVNPQVLQSSRTNLVVKPYLRVRSMPSTMRWTSFTRSHPSMSRPHVAFASKSTVHSNRRHCWASSQSLEETSRTMEYAM